MLHAKDQLFNWVIPVKQNRSSLIQGLRINCKHKNAYISRTFLDENLPEITPNEVKVAFLLDGPKAFLVINPPNGVPFYKFISYKNSKGKRNSPTIGSKQLSDLFKKRFVTESNVLDFTLEKYENINGMILWHIVLVSD